METMTSKVVETAASVGFTWSTMSSHICLGSVVLRPPLTKSAIVSSRAKRLKPTGGDSANLTICECLFEQLHHRHADQATNGLAVLRHVHAVLFSDLERAGDVTLHLGRGHDGGAGRGNYEHSGLIWSVCGTVKGTTNVL